MNRINSPLPRSPTIQRCYGNPRMLRAVERIYGEDFCPFAESLVLKNPHDGAGFTFHQVPHVHSPASVLKRLIIKGCLGVPGCAAAGSVRAGAGG